MIGSKNLRSRAKPKVAFVTQWYAPEPTSVPVITAKSLQRLGFDVRVLTGIPNLPDGKTHSGYRAWRTGMETRDGVRLFRTPLVPSHSSSALGRIVNYVSWAASSAIFGRRVLGGADLNVVHCTPATTALPAYVSRFFRKVPYVVIVQDLWPDTVFASGMMNRGIAGRLGRIAEAAVDRLYGGASAIVVISPGMKRALKDRGHSESKIHLVFNSVDEDSWHPGVAPERRPSTRKAGREYFHVGYAGNLGSAQDLSSLIRACAIVSTQLPIKLTLAGEGVERGKLEELARECLPGHVTFTGWLAARQTLELQTEFDLCVVSLKKDALFEMTVPSKLQGLLSSALPVLGIVEGDAADIVESAGAGITAEPGNVEDIARAIITASEVDTSARLSWGMSGRRYYEENMAECVREERLGEILGGVLSDAQR